MTLTRQTGISANTLLLLNVKLDWNNRCYIIVDIASPSFRHGLATSCLDYSWSAMTPSKI